MNIPEDKTIVLFDGVCNLCNGFVQFIISHDKENHFLFSSLQSAAAEELLLGQPMAPGYLDSIVVVQEGRVYTHSAAIVQILKLLPGFSFMAAMLQALPKFLRDGAYKFIARKRYWMFGQSDSCWLPTPELNAKFIVRG